MTTPRLPRPHTFLIAVPFCLCFLSKAPAQATRTASKAADISVFGGFEGAHPDYGSYNSYGGTFGVDYTRSLHCLIEPSLEFRANFHSNEAVVEHSFVIGLRAAAPFRLIKPYAMFLVGPGTIDFPQNIGYTHDNSTVYSYGAGVDLRITRSFAGKLDLQAQHWNTGDFTYTPTIGTVGIVYTIPFRAHVSQRDLGR